MFQCPLVTTCLFFENCNWGANIYSEIDGEKEYNTIDCTKCFILDNETYQEYIEKMVNNGRSTVEIFFYLNYLLNKERGANYHE